MTLIHEWLPDSADASVDADLPRRRGVAAFLALLVLRWRLRRDRCGVVLRVDVGVADRLLAVRRTRRTRAGFGECVRGSTRVATTTVAVALGTPQPAVQVTGAVTGLQPCRVVCPVCVCCVASIHTQPPLPAYGMCALCLGTPHLVRPPAAVAVAVGWRSRWSR